MTESSWTLPLLRDGTPEDVGLDPGPLARAVSRLSAWAERGVDPDRPMYSGQVTLVAHDGVVVVRAASGYALRYADRDGTPLPEGERIPMRTNTIFDLASLSKLFTCVVAMQQVEAGRLALDATVLEYLPRFAPGITIGQLMSHTSGLPAEPDPPLWRLTGHGARIDSLLAATPLDPPGAVCRYSDVNLLVLQLVLAEVTGESLDTLVHNGITAPLGLRDTMYRPPGRLRPRIAAQEYKLAPRRELAWGVVHDENALALGGVAGHAGVFATVDDMAIVGQALLAGGGPILSPESVALMLTDHTAGRPGECRGLGFQLDRPWYMGRMSGPRTAGHTGFTGTSLVLDPLTRSLVLLFTNRVHPARTWGVPNAARVAIADALASARAR